MDIKALENMYTFVECIHMKMRRIGIKNKTFLHFVPNSIKDTQIEACFFICMCCALGLQYHLFCTNLHQISDHFRYFTYH